MWEKLRRLLRSGRFQIEESGLSLSPIAAVSLIPESVEVAIKIVLIGSTEHYYLLQDADPEFARHFRIKVDFAESTFADAGTRRSSAVFVAHTCCKFGLPQFTATGVVRLLERSHREVDDQSRQSAIFAAIEALVIESVSFCRARGATLVDGIDVNAALAAQALRHDYPEQRPQESIVEGERLIVVSGGAVGQLNGLTQIDLGDYRFGFPVRITARTCAGEDGLLNIEREVEMCRPIHDKGVLIPYRNLRHLMLSEKIVDAVAKGVFHVHTADHVMEGVPPLLARACGISDKEGVFAPDSVLGRAQVTLQAYRRSCQLAEAHQNPPRRRVV